MIIVRRIKQITFGSMLLAVVCLGSACAIFNQNDSGSTEIITRELPWDGSTALVLDIASEARYVQSTGPATITARGPHRSVSTLTVTNGHIHDQLLHTGAVLEIVINAPSVNSFYLNGHSRLRIENYDQDSLRLATDGSAAIDATGRAERVNVVMQGAGAIGLAEFNVDVLSASLNGASTLVSAPTDSATFHVRNFATAVLLSKPKTVDSKLEHSGRLIEAAPVKLN